MAKESTRTGNWKLSTQHSEPGNQLRSLHNAAVTGH